jgi:filamentous hemagglutinin family protein
MRKFEPKQTRRLNRLAVSLLVGLWAVTPGWVYALPIDGNVVAGTGLITETAPQQMEILQTTPKLAIDWQGFSIYSGESVTFNQPNSSAVALNRVIGVDPSKILGNLTANGQVFLTNPSGVVFGKNAVVDVHGLLATTLNISNEDFLNSKYQFSQDPNRPLAKIINDGVIHATRYVGLVAPAVETNGAIVVMADLGSIALASGTAATLDFNGDGLISFAVADAEGKALLDRINNSKLIRANEGQVLLTARSAGKVIGNVVNHSGIIEAQAVQQKNGKIILSGGDTGIVKVSGILDAPHVFITADVVAVAANKFLSTNNGNVNITANHLDIKGDLDSGTGDVAFTLAGGGDLNIGPGNNPNEGLGNNDIRHIIAENLILKTDGDINVKGIPEEDTDGIKDSVILNSGGNITFEDAVSVFPALKLFAITDININADVTTTQGDFVAVADSEGNGIGDFNVAPGVVIASARDIDVSAPNINADESSFNETRNLILNGSVAGGVPQPPIDTDSIQQGSLSSFLTEFFENGGPGNC